MEHSPSIQHAAENMRLFVDSSGAALSIFLDISGVDNRPKLIRTLRNSGAAPCRFPKDASILLVDADSISGRQFVRDWAADPNKVVLGYQWARRCVAQRRLLLEDDDWGGFRVSDDGEDIDSEDEYVEEIQKSPLPTPRPTPSELPGTIRTTKPPSIPSHLQPKMQTPQSQSQPQLQSQSQTQVQPQVQPQPPFINHNYPPMHNPFSQLSPSSPFAPMFGLNPQFQYPNPMMQAPSVISLVESAIHLARQQGADTTQLQAVHASLSQHPPQQPTSHPFLFPNMQNYTNSPAIAGSSQHPPSEARSLAQPQLPDNISDGSDIEDSFIAQEPPAPSLKRKGRSVSPASPPRSAPSSRSKGKQKADQADQASRLHRRKSSLTRSRPFPPPVASDRPPSLFSIASTPSATFPPKDLQSRREDKGVFRVVNGPLRMFVQIDIRNRREIVISIKKNGGIITADIAVAAYAVLSVRSTTYHSLRGEAERHGTPVVLASFVHDCITEGRLLDPEEYSLDESSAKKKRGRQPKLAQDKAIKPSEAKPKGRRKTIKQKTPSLHGDRSPTPAPPMETKEMSGGRYYFTDAEINYARMYFRRLIEIDPNISLANACIKLSVKMPHHTSGSWQQTMSKRGIWEEAKASATSRPPPEDVVHNGNNHISHDDDDDTDEDIQGVRDLLGEDDHVGDEGPSAGEPMMNFFGKEFKEHDEAPSTSVVTPGPNLQPVAPATELHVEPVPTAPLAPASIPTSLLAPTSVPTSVLDDSSDSTQVRADFEAIVGFLSSADADDGGEEEVWALLTRLHHCQTAPDWRTFVERHSEAVMEEVARRCQLQTTPS